MCIRDSLYNVAGLSFTLKISDTFLLLENFFIFNFLGTTIKNLVVFHF
jgi:hypothetical protein